MMDNRSQTQKDGESGKSEPPIRGQESPATQSVSTTEVGPPPEAPRRRSRDGSRHSSGSAGSTIIKVKLLQAEAEHARRVAALERARIDQEQAAQQAKFELERKVADAELRAQLVAIEASGSSGSGSQQSRASSRTRESHRKVENWLSGYPGDGTTEEPMDRLPGVDATVVLAPHPVGLHKSPIISNPLPKPMISKNFQENISNENSKSLSKALDRLADVLNTNSKPKTYNLNLPTFDGTSASEWLSFKRTYLDTEQFYSAGENLARLNMALRGAARDVVYVLLVSARDPHQVLSALEDRFGCTEKIILQELNSVRALPKLSNDGKDLPSFAARVSNCVQIIHLLQQPDYLRSPELFNILLSKLTPMQRMRWFDYAAYHCDKLSKLEMLAGFLTREVQLQNKFGVVVFDPAGPSTSHTHNRSQAQSNVKSRVHCSVSENCNHFDSKSDVNKKSNTFVNKNVNCIFCEQDHDIVKCDKFLSLSTNDRWKWIKTNKVCHRCLRKSLHRFKFCKNKTSCGINGCVYKHHTLLHNDNAEHNVIAHAEVDAAETSSSSSTSQSEGEESDGKECTVEVSAHAATNSPCKRNLRSLLKIIAVKVSGPAGSMSTFALLDDGCTTTLIDSTVSNRIGAVGPKGRVHIDCMGGLSKITDFCFVDFSIQGVNSSTSYEIRQARSVDNLGIKYQRTREEDIDAYSHLRDLAEYVCYENAQPMIIIGIDNCHLTVPRSIRAGSESEPMAIETVLGWVVCGSIKGTFQCDKENFNHAVHFDDEISGSDSTQNLEDLIKYHYKLDSIGIEKKDYRSKSDTHALKTLESTVRRLPDGHFESGLLWRPDISEVPNNYKLALSRFLNLEKKMKSDVNYAKLYSQNINSMLAKSYAEECCGPPAGILWYLPHFGVTHPHKPGKLRVVHDAAAKFKGVSLNSLLLPGPDLLQPLLGILMRFREDPIAITADIREMFPQVKIREQDRDAQRFLWREDPSQEIKIYRMESMIFGACSSPCTALYVKQLNANEFQSEFPKAAHASVFDTYMDDYIGSHEDVETAARLAVDIVHLNKRGGFEMRGWVSNNPAALSLLPKEFISEKCYVNSSSVELFSTENSLAIRTLGIIWKPMLDVITFSTGIKSDNLPCRLTKRDALSSVMRVYDPLGILGPIVSRGRIMLQNLWRKNLSWDDELPQTELSLWNDWFKDLNFVSDLQIQRCYGLSEFPVSERELHVFCDASELAYAAVAYWRIVDTNGGVKVALISSKCRVAPLKPTSIPRLELQAALIAARLASFIYTHHKHKPKRRIFWSDSQNVLGWLQSDARSYKPFVAHRLGEILELTQVNEWRWIPSEANVADDATRINRGPILETSRWLVGPDFLQLPERSWPSLSSVDKASRCKDNDVELKPSARPKCNVNIITSCSFPMPLVVSSDRLSSWTRLLRATARAHKFIDLLRHKGTSEITIENLHQAEVHLLRQSQLETFPDEIACLRDSKPLPRKSKLLKLSPFIDENNLIRLRGRIARALDIADEMKRPVILDSRHRTVQLIIQHYHEKAAHGNTEMVVNELRQTYWIIHLRSAVRSVAYNCKVCRLRRAKPFDPPMGDLPEARLAHHKRPFSFSGLDYFGPLQVSVGRRREKRYVALYTCLVTRAIHLEIVHSLSTDAAIMSLRRFIARRGVPSEIWSDNGTAFVGANRILKTLYGSSLEEFAANERISWKFIPPSAPFMGGAWERLVRSVKSALKITLKERSPTDEVLATLLMEAEALVNSRPLTHVPCDPEKEEALTPFHFILGKSSGKPVPASLEDTDLNGRSGWKKACRLSDHFWARWIKEYLPTLQQRTPGSLPRVKIGDVIIIVDDQLPRGTWPKGRVVKLCPGDDGIPRVAIVQTKSGLLKRPLRKLIPICGGE